MYFSQNLQLLRKVKGLKQDEIQGFKGPQWSNYERGESKPNFDDLVAISKFFEINIDDLLNKDLSKDVSLIAHINGGRKGGKSLSKCPRTSPPNLKNRGNNTAATIVSDNEEVYQAKQRMPSVITVDNTGKENVIFVPVKARAGYLNGYADPEYIANLPAYSIPGLNHGTFRLFEVEGLSMHPTIHPGDVIIGQNVSQMRDVRDDRVYVVITKNEGIVVKRVLNRIEKDGKLILKSDNYKERDAYPTIVCDPVDVIEIWYATGFISRQMRPPAEMYNRLIDLEGKFTLLENLVQKNIVK